MHANRPYDESLEVPDADEVATQYTVTPSPRFPEKGTSIDKAPHIMIYKLLLDTILHVSCYQKSMLKQILILHDSWSLFNVVFIHSPVLIIDKSC